MKCLTPKCNNNAAPVTNKGLCLKCYSAAKRMVEAGTTTWNQLSVMGLAQSGDDADPFVQAFREKIGGNDAASA